jgi:hypothetical protein
MQLTWKASESASCLYAATCIAAGHAPADRRLAAAFAPGVELALGEFAACGVPADRWLPTLTGLAASGVEGNRQLVDQTITKLAGSGAPAGALAGRLAGCLAGLKAAFQEAYRDTAIAGAAPLVDELLLRGRPLAAQWEARGPGMLWHIARSTEEGVLAERADVVLVYPLVGGHGLAHLPVNTVTFEAVLANPVDDLPEVVRLTWLLAQLNLDLPKFTERLPATRRERVAQLAMVPPVLAAAEHVELGRFSTDAIERAIVVWRQVDANASPADVAATAGTLMTWWTTYQAGTTPWVVALAALDQMLTGASGDRP